MSGTTFTYPLAKRIVSSTKWTEEQRGIIPEIETPIILNGNQDLLVRTNSTLPVGYTGAMAVQGEIVEQKQDGTYVPQMPIWIRDQNGGMLNSNTIYQARVAGTWTQEIITTNIITLTTLGLYLVQLPLIPKPSMYSDVTITGQGIVLRDGDVFDRGINAYYKIYRYQYNKGMYNAVLWMPRSTDNLVSIPLMTEALGNYIYLNVKCIDTGLTINGLDVLIPERCQLAYISSRQRYEFVQAEPNVFTPGIASQIKMPGWMVTKYNGFYLTNMVGNFLEYVCFVNANGWVYAINGYPPLTAGIGSGIGSGISGV
jgi:hypothetical protein